MPEPVFTVVAAAPEHADALARLFQADASPCYCRYWHFEGERNDWLARCAFSPDANEAEMREALASGSPDAKGLVAVTPEGEVIGWMKLSPASSVRKLYDQRIYRGLPCFEGDRSGVFTIGCFLVHPAHRRRGIARALLEKAIDLAPSWGARVLEAFPRRISEAAHDAELMLGPHGIFLENGFQCVHEIGPYPVLRREL